MSTQLIDFESQAQEFLKLLFQDLNKNRIEVLPNWVIDHLCYRTATETEYNILKNEFLNFSDLLIESPVNGRLISTFKLHKSIAFQSWSIEVIELPSPKKGKTASTGFEHIEVVCDVPFSKLIEKYSYLKLDLGGLSKPLNQELEICLGARNIKFHHMPLSEVIQIELKAQASAN
jgi:hypothetical protein